MPTAVVVADPKSREVTLFDERLVFIAAIAKFAQAQGCRVGIADKVGEDDPVIVIDLPAGQAHWWVPADGTFLFDGLLPYDGELEGTDRLENIRRLVAFSPKKPRTRKPSVKKAEESL